MSAVGAASTRTRLAELALAAALETDGAVRGDPGPRGLTVTQVGLRQLDGVAVAAADDDRYDVLLSLVARPVPLRPLADKIRTRVARSAGRERLADALGAVSVVFQDVDDDGAAG